MILEGFEIENWSCIKRVAVSELPPTGVVVLCGPNGTGKSSIVEALRACLMDNKSTSKALDRGFPKNSTEKPRVSVTFRAAGSTWRITKQFNSKESKLESRTSSGQWKLETADASEAHDRTRQLCGGTDSSLGLHQLLWLTQAEFRLPEPKKLDGSVQSQLRAVLGVLQTPLDDRFLTRVKKEWSNWFGARSKPGEKPKLKKDSSLDKALTTLAKAKDDLAVIEDEYRRFEAMAERLEELEIELRNIRSQLKTKSKACEEHQVEYEKSLARLVAYENAEQRVQRANGAFAAAQSARQRRVDIEGQIERVTKLAEAADREVEEATRQLREAEQQLGELRFDEQTARATVREKQDQLAAVGERTQLLTLREQVRTAQERWRSIERSLAELEELKRQAREYPAIDPATIEKLEKNRARAAKLRADLEAAAITLALVPEPGVPDARLTIDGNTLTHVASATGAASIRHSIRRRAEIHIPGWGRAELARGSDVPSVDQIEIELRDLEEKFSAVVASFGLPANDPTVLDRLREIAAHQKVREPQLLRKQEEIDQLAPKGLETYQEVLAKLEKRLKAKEAEHESRKVFAHLPLDATELDGIAETVKKAICVSEGFLTSLLTKIGDLVREIDGDGADMSSVGKKSSSLRGAGARKRSLREQEAEAKVTQASLRATLKLHQEEEKRVLSAKKIEDDIRLAEADLDRAKTDLEAAKLSENETTIVDRLKAIKEAVEALERTLSNKEKEFFELRGALSQSEGLHQRRAIAAARVEELARRAERENLESDAYDRLYALFEECREKQLGTVMGPIHDRVVGWMRLLRICNYQSIGFNDQFLPEKLIAGGGLTELTLSEESTGTIEQIGLMVRLALGSTLSTAEEPAVAILDDPLTHSDVVRLDRMRAVLRNAAAGDPNGSRPAGPLQIVIFTCHGEWFDLEGAKVIDLSKPDVLSRYS